MASLGGAVRLPDSIRDTEGAEGTLKGLGIRTPHT